MDKTNLPKSKGAAIPEPAPGRPPNRPGPPPKPPLPPLFRAIDWWTFATTTLLMFFGYYCTLAPDLTLEDAGELAVGSFYAGVPHPPGYPVWTLYTWLFTILVPFSNIAWRVALSSAVAAAFSCGLLALLVSRGSSMILESVAELKNIERRRENAICIVSGYVSSLLMGFNGYMWSQAVIVEVYTFSVLSLMGVLAFLMRWIYAPEQRRYLYWAFFIFGICFTNHQTLVVAAMGIEVAIAAANLKLGRDLFLGNSLVYVLGLIGKTEGFFGSFDNNPSLFMIYNLVGIGSIAACTWLTMKTQNLLTEWKPALILGGLWLLGTAFYLYMPVASMTNPPLNWGYPRTWEGFVHALTRGQYEKANPTNLFQDPIRFIQQLWMYGVGVVEEFNFAYLLIGLVPFFFFRRMQPRERAWLGGLFAIFICLAVLLLILLNPAPDRQSRELNRPFFTASHVMIAMFIGYGLTLIAATLELHYQAFRRMALYGCAVAGGIALYGYASLESHYFLAKLNALIGIGLAAAGIVLLAFKRERLCLTALLAVYAVLPAYSILAHWSDNEQRGHLFGYWFGHDMFTPPFKASDGKPLYPEMAKNAVLFGGTDPGRFNPTYMIFCESFIPPEKKQKTDPHFDRRDVYLITQNALADKTYLDYIRAQYNRSAQKDPHFFQDMLRTQKDFKLGRTNFLAQLFLPVDRYFTQLGHQMETRRREQGVYPPQEIITPSNEDSSDCFQEYISDAQRRLQLSQLKVGEDVKIIDNKIQVTGQVAVMAINGLLTKRIFDRNPEHEFYVEESFPLDWMYPHLTPYGIIMKIERQPATELTDEMAQRDQEFWSQYSRRLIGNWLTPATTVEEICRFVDRVYVRRDFAGFTGDRKFIRDDNAQKSFSKLRSALAGLYSWRYRNSKSDAEKARMYQAADFALRQAFAYCPFSPEAVYRYIELLTSPGVNRLDDALLVAETCYKFDLENRAIEQLIKQLRDIRASGVYSADTNPQGAFHAQNLESLTNIQDQFNLASAFLQARRTNEALNLLDNLIAHPKADATVILSVAKAYADLLQAPRLEAALRRLVQVVPESPEAWYDLAAIQATLGRPSESLLSLTQAITLSQQRRAQDSNARDLLTEAQNDGRFDLIRDQSEFKQLFPPK